MNTSLYDTRGPDIVRICEKCKLKHLHYQCYTLHKLANIIYKRGYRIKSEMKKGKCNFGIEV